MPGYDEALRKRYGAKQEKANQRQEEYAGESKVWPHVSRDDLNVKAEALVGSDELRNRCANGCIDRSILESDEALGHGGRQSNLEKGPPYSRTG